MARVRDMQGVSAHLTFLKKTDKTRRHPAHCIYASGKGKNRICTSEKSIMFNLNCKSSVHCENYKEKDQ